jgi:hypothetical protein
MFIAEGGTIWYSEPYAFGLYDKARCFIPFNSRVILLEPVKNGIFVSDKNAIWFIEGDTPDKFEAIQKTTFPALEWSAAIERVEISKLGFDVPGLGILFGSTQGALLGTPDGQIINLTDNKAIYPPLGSRGAGLLKGDNFIHSLFY